MSVVKRWLIEWFAPHGGPITDPLWVPQVVFSVLAVLGVVYIVVRWGPWS